MEKWLFQAFDDAYNFRQALETGNTREYREDDQIILERKVQRYSNFAGLYGFPQLNVEKATSVQITEYLNRSKNILAAFQN